VTTPYSTQSAPSRPTLTVKKGDAFFEVHVYRFPDDQTRAMGKTLAQAIVQKLH
jgi:hypothetical protein